MGHVDRGSADTPVEIDDFLAGVDPERGVEVRQGLVHQEGAGLAHDRAPQRDALALAPGELRRLAREQMPDPEHPGRGGDVLDDLRALGPGAGHEPADEGRAFERAEPAHGERHGHVLGHGEVGIERVVLEHHRDVAIGGAHGRDVAVGDAHAARVGALEPGDHAHQGGFAAAGWTDEGEEFTGRDRHRNRLDGDDASERSRQPLDLDPTHTTLRRGSA